MCIEYGYKITYARQIRVFLWHYCSPSLSLSSTSSTTTSISTVTSIRLIYPKLWWQFLRKREREREREGELKSKIPATCHNKENGTKRREEGKLRVLNGRMLSCTVKYYTDLYIHTVHVISMQKRVSLSSMSINFEKCTRNMETSSWKCYTIVYYLHYNTHRSFLA